MTMSRKTALLLLAVLALAPAAALAATKDGTRPAEERVARAQAAQDVVAGRAAQRVGQARSVLGRGQCGGGRKRQDGEQEQGGLP